MRHLLSKTCWIWLCLLSAGAYGQVAVAPSGTQQPGPAPWNGAPVAAAPGSAPPQAYDVAYQKGMGPLSQPQPTLPQGQTAQPPGAASQYGSQSPLAPAAGGDMPQPGGTLQPPGMQAPGPLAAAPAPEPPLPAWGNYLAPSEVPTALPPVDYQLVGPPRGILQHAEKQDYNRTVGDPSGLVFQDSQMLQNIDLYRPDGLAPIGVFNDHTLVSGRVMVSYRYLQNEFDGLYVNSQQVSYASVQSQYRYVPTHMLQDSQVALLEYGLTDDFTFTAMLPWQHNLIDYGSAGGTIATGFTNPGDIRLNGLLVVRRGKWTQQHVNVGLSIPVGLLEDAYNETPSATIPNLSYPLRTSSGTYDLLLGYTIRGQYQNWTWGTQLNGTVRTGLNTLGYRQGDAAEVTGWLSRRFGRYVATSFRLDYQMQGNIYGADARLDTAQAPTNDPNHFGYQRLNTLIGINFYLPDGRIPNQRLSLEAGLPAFQSVEGPQLGLDWILNAGWSMIF